MKRCGSSCRVSLGVMLSLCAAAGLVAQASGPEVRDVVGFQPPIGVRLPMETELLDDAGAACTLADCAAGRPMILALVYFHCPVLCNEVVREVVRAAEKMPLRAGTDYQVAFISIDPTERAPDARRRRVQIREWSGGKAGGAGYHLLTGSAPAVAALADAVGFRYRYMEEADEFAHASGICIVSPDGVLSRAFRGIEYPSRDLRLGLVQAADGEVGGVVDRLLLLCYRWDPAAGRYGLAIDRSLRIGGVLTAGLLLLLIARTLWRERRARRVAG